MMINKAKGKHLTNLALIFGYKRKWFGFEPDFMLRRRILKSGATR